MNEEVETIEKKMKRKVISNQKKSKKRKKKVNKLLFSARMETINKKTLYIYTK